MMTPASFLKVISFAKHGQDKNVLNVLKELSSMKTESVQLLVLNVTPLIKPLDTVSPALLAMIMLKENVFTPQKTPLDPQILAVLLGIGIIKNVSPAPNGGLSMLITFVFQFLINVKLVMNLVIVLHATRAMTLRMDNVFGHLTMKPNPLTLDVELGIGITVYVSPALMVGLLMMKKFALLFLINVRPMTRVALAPHVMKAMTSKKVFVFSQISTMLIPQI